MNLSLEFTTPLIMQDIHDMHERTWQRIAGAGTWLDGPTRVAIAEEVREAGQCQLCHRRKESLSPFSESGDHNGVAGVSQQILEVVHHIVTDPGRLTRRWYEQALESGLSDAEYVEIVGLTCTLISVDTFYRGLGIPLLTLPQPIEGEPNRERPVGAKHQLAWVPTVEPEDFLDGEFNPYREDNRFNVQKALSLVPRTLIEFYDVDETYYLPQGDIRNFNADYRALSHSQMELIGSRGAQINQCHYCSLSHAGVLLDSAKHEGRTANLKGIIGEDLDKTGIELGSLLVRFTDALLLDDDKALVDARFRLYEQAGPGKLVDAAATAASFNSIPRIPNATGIPLEDWKHEKLFPVMEEFGIGDFVSKQEASYNV